MTEVVDSNIHGPSRVTIGNGGYFHSGKAIAFPKRQIQASEYPSGRYQRAAIICNPAPPTSPFTSGGATEIRFNLDGNAAGHLIHPALRFKITEGSAQTVWLAPVRQWFTKIEIRNSNTDRILQTLYPEDLTLRLLALPHENLRIMAPLENIEPDTLGESLIRLGASRSKYFFMSLTGTILDAMKPDLRLFTQVTTAIQIRLFPTAIVSSGSGTAQLSELALVAEQITHSSEQHKVLLAKIYKQPIGWLSLQAVQISQTALTWVASTNYKYTLDNFKGRFAALAFCVRLSSGLTNTAGATSKYIDMGPNSAVDLVDPSGASLWSTGSAVLSNYVQKVMKAQLLDSDVGMGSLKNFYVLPFSETKSTHPLWNGELRGFREFTGDKTSLSITTDAAAVAEVHTITLTNPANDGGKYRLMWRGDVTTSLAYNADAAAIKAALCELTSFKKLGIVAADLTVSGAFTTTASITFSARLGRVSRSDNDVIQMLTDNLNDGTVAESSSSALTTAGESGFWNNGGATVQLDIFGLQYRVYSFNGESLAVQDL